MSEAASIWSRRILTAALVLLLAGGLLWAYRALREGGPPEPSRGAMSRAEMAVLNTREAGRGSRQPLPFNHRFHVRELSLTCVYCHGDARSSEAAALPSLSLCMGCHRIAGGDLTSVGELRDFAERETPIPWVRVYRLPEFVQFSHRAHTRNRIDCTECHGPVENMVRVHRWSPLSMGWCLECHLAEPAPGDSATTYRLVRRSPSPPMPDGRQPEGLNPYRLSRGYGETRGPTDCAACHY